MGIRKAQLCAAAMAALFLTACAPTGAPAGSDPSGTTAAGTTAPGGGAGDRDACLIGTWAVDVNDMSRQIAAMLQTARGTGAAEGTVTMVFGDTMTVKYDNTVIITVPNDPVSIVFRQTFTGDATSTDWSAKDGKLTGVLPADTVKTKIEMTIGGQQVPPTMTDLGGALDLSANGLGYTCAADSATLIAPTVTWKMTRSS
jgi:hypothetical protein